MRADTFAFRFTGRIDIPADGGYTFFTSSDDGSVLYIDGKLVVNNDGLHALKEANGAVTLTRGFHEIMIGYIELGGDHVLTVSWQGPGIGKQAIPASAFTHRPGEQTPIRMAMHPGVTGSSIGLGLDGAAIRFTIPAAYRGAPVSLDLYSIRGQRIATMIRGEVAVGTYQISLDAIRGSQARGYAICRLTVGGESRQIRLPMVR
jgi:hypothetical protein